MARQIKTNQALEDDRPTWEGGGKENEQTRCCATVCDHVQDGAKAGRLAEVPGCQSVEGVEEAGDAVEEGTSPGVQGHVVEGADGEDDACVPWELMLVLVWDAPRGEWDV